MRVGQSTAQKHIVVCHPAIVGDSLCLAQMIETSISEHKTFLKQGGYGKDVKHMFYRIYRKHQNFVVEAYEALPVRWFQFKYPKCPTTMLNFFSFCRFNGNLVFFSNQDFRALGITIDKSKEEVVDVGCFPVEIPGRYGATFSSSSFLLDGTPVNKGKRIKLMK